MYGTIALDIDGTLTTDMGNHMIPPRVLTYLSDLVKKGWQIMFITGRTFLTCYKTLQEVPFPYYLAVQNGAIILEMPARKILAKKYLHRSVFKEMEIICHGDPSDFVLYSGFEHNDVSYYRPKQFSSDLLAYLEKRMSGFGESWQAVDSYDELTIDEFASLKCFGKYEAALRLTTQIEKILGLHVPLIRDPFDESYYVVQATHPDISKGTALKDMLALTGRQGIVIAAGDDRNDCPMLAVADVKIAMATSPAELLQMAHIIAPPATEEGIIVALEAALKP